MDVPSITIQKTYSHRGNRKEGRDASTPREPRFAHSPSPLSRIIVILCHHPQWPVRPWGFTILTSKAKTTPKYLLKTLSRLLSLVGACFFLFGGRAIHEFGNVERVLAEVLGLAMAAALFFCGFMANSAVKDLEWEEASEEGIQEESELRCGRK